MVCTKCGHTIPQNNRFCPYCGTPVPTVSSPTISPSIRKETPVLAQTKRKKELKFQKEPQNAFALAGGLLCVVALFLPFLTASSSGLQYSLSLFDTVTQVGMDLALWFLFLSIAAIIVLQFLRLPPFISAVLAILGLVLLMMEVITAHDTMQAYTLSGVTMSYSFGFYLLIIALLLVLFSGPIKNWKKRH